LAKQDYTDVLIPVDNITEGAEVNKTVIIENTANSSDNTESDSDFANSAANDDNASASSGTAADDSSADSSDSSEADTAASNDAEGNNSSTNSSDTDNNSTANSAAAGNNSASEQAAATDNNSDSNSESGESSADSSVTGETADNQTPGETASDGSENDIAADDSSVDANTGNSDETNSDAAGIIEATDDFRRKPVSELTDEEFAMLAPTTAMSFEEIVGDSGEYDGYPKAFPYNDTYSIIVDKRYQIVMVYTKDENGEYTIPVRYMKCSSGATSSETGGGTFKMRDYRVRFGLFRNTNSYAQYWSLIYGRIYFHSLLYSQKDAATYTESSYNNLGHKCSHGCIRLTVPDARWIWYNVGPGTVCTIREGSADDEETKAISERLVLPALPDKRPSIKMGEIPWTDNWTIEEVPQEVPFVNGSQD